MHRITAATVSLHPRQGINSDQTLPKSKILFLSDGSGKSELSLQLISESESAPPLIVVYVYLGV